MATDDVAMLIDQNRNVEAESADAAGDLLDLLVRVCTWISRIELNAIDGTVTNGEFVL